MAVDVLARVYRRMQKIFHNIMAAIETLCLFPSRLRDHPKTHRKPLVGACLGLRTLENFAQEIDRLFSAPLGQANMLNMSEQMRHQFLAGLQSSQVNMLPSYTYALPTGKEKGTYLALDVGGSTFRVALVELRGRNNGMEILRVASSPIDNTVKLLEGTAFFDWLAERIDQMLSSGDVKYGRDSAPLVMGLSWSFPIEQTSIRSGDLIEMGKGFLCSDGTVGQDLNELIIQACRKRDLNLRLDAIVNDSSAALLSRAYDDPATRMSLILGTGTNMAIHFPVHALGITKFGSRPREWFDVAKHVIINTEMSMFGGGVLPMTRWDEYLNRTHLRPDYQPLEYMITGRYLGEIVRLIILEAAETAGLFGGELPHTLRNPYTLDTAIVASIEADSSASLSTSSAYLQKEHTFHIAPSLADMLFLRQVCTVVSQRAAAYLATGIHSLWCLRNDAEFATNPSVILGKDAQIETMEVSMVPEDDQGRNLTIACDGSVINKYPGFRERCQGYLEMLSQQAGSKSSELASTETTSPSIHLDPADESAILGAAVAVAVAAAQ